MHQVCHAISLQIRGGRFCKGKQAFINKNLQADKNALLKSASQAFVMLVDNRVIDLLEWASKEIEDTPLQVVQCDEPSKVLMW